MTNTYTALTGRLVFTTAVHIGSGEGGEVSDAYLRRDTKGDPFLPGSALGGALRTLATRLAPRLQLDAGRPACLAIEPGAAKDDDYCGCAVCHLFGDVRPGVGDTDKAMPTQASRLWVYDAPLSAATPTQVRDGVGIDRASGAAASAGAVKFDLELLPAGSEFELRLELREASAADEKLLAATLAEWQAGRGRLGGRTARGLGAFKLDGLALASLPLAEPDSLMAFLRSPRPWDVAEDQKNKTWSSDQLKAVQVRPSPIAHNSAIASSWLEVTFRLQFDGPFLMHDAALAGLIGFDHAPLLQGLPPANGEGQQPQPLLAGAGLRGVLRAHAERIARTLASYRADQTDDPEIAFLRSCPACDPNQADAKGPLANCDRLLAGPKSEASNEPLLPSDKEAGAEHLCLSCWLFGSARRGSRLAVDDAPLAGEPQWKAQDFLAIDRFTGGGLDGAKFDALALWQPTFAARLFLENPAEWELGWLALLLRDLHDGLLSLGFGAAKGYGRGRARELQTTFGFITPDDLPAKLAEHVAPAAPETSSSVYRTLAFSGPDYAAHRDTLNGWIDAFQAKVAAFARAEGGLPALPADSYFGGDLEKLYPILPQER